jgi:CheY-like chemotaxis protein
MLRGEGLSAEEIADGLTVIERNARVQTQLIEDLLDVSRIISGKVRLDVQSIELGSVAEAAVTSVKPAADAKGVRLQTVLDPLDGPVMGDPARLQQIIWNLLTNAIKFTPRGGRVQVCMRRVNSDVEITVSDTGLGIRPEFLPHVFERFRQEDGSTTRRHGGLGLGLAIVKHLTEMHGGSVRAESSGEGQGATFIVQLPLAIVHRSEKEVPDWRRDPRVLAEGRGTECPPVLKGARVLVVDDEPDGREIIKRMLERCNAVVATASSAAEARLLLREFRPDVLVSDIGMPGEDGYEFMKTIRASSDAATGAMTTGGRKLPSIALTAFARSEDRRRALLAGFDMHIAKPVDAAELITVVARLADRL